jgi:hypothetical protein
VSLTGPIWQKTVLHKKAEHISSSAHGMFDTMGSKALKVTRHLCQSNWVFLEERSWLSGQIAFQIHSHLEMNCVCSLFSTWVHAASFLPSLFQQPLMVTLPHVNRVSIFTTKSLLQLTLSACGWLGCPCSVTGHPFTFLGPCFWCCPYIAYPELFLSAYRGLLVPLDYILWGTGEQETFYFSLSLYLWAWQ